MFQGVNRQPRQPDFPSPEWDIVKRERGHMIIADRHCKLVAGLPPGTPWTPQFWLWLPYKGRKAETREDRRQRLGGKRPYAEDQWALEDAAAADSFGETTRAAAIEIIADAAAPATAAATVGEPTARPHRARRLLRQTRRSSSDSPSETSSTTTSSTTSTDAHSTDMKELFTDLSTVAAATAAADAAYQDDSDDTRAKRALLRPKKMAKACGKRPVANSKTHNVGDTIS